MMKVLVTGGASGLGSAIVKKLAEADDYFVYFTYAKSSLAANEIEKSYTNTKAVHCDFLDNDSLEKFLEQLGSLEIDILINNAYGKIYKEHFHKIDHNIFLDSFKCNVIPCLRITQQAIKVFRKKKFGKILNIVSSYVINKPPIGLSEYTCNKAYIVAMSKSWATENGNFNITSNCISPSFMKTDLTSDTDERIIDQMVNDHPLKKLLTIDEVAESVLYYAKCSQQINGTNFIINAGYNFQ